jgi:hypothetical protein
MNKWILGQMNTLVTLFVSIEGSVFRVTPP